MLWNSKNINFKKTNDELLKKIGSKSFYSYKNTESGFVAVVFENIKTGEIVIGFRGTERIGLGENYNDVGALTKDIQTDINLIFANPDKQFSDAYEFYKLVKSQNQKSKITILGQSLGGALAQLVGAKIFCETKQKIKTFSYNAPGCFHLLDIIGCDKTIDYSFITNYAVMNDWCGMFGEKIGRVFLIPPIPPKNLQECNPIEALENILLTSHEGIFNYSGRVTKKPKDFNQAEGLALWLFDKNNPIKDFDSPSEFINSIIPSPNTAQIATIGKAIQSKFEDFIEGQNPKIQELSEQIQTLSEDFFEEQKEKFNDLLNKNMLVQISNFLDATFTPINRIALINALSVLKKNEYT